MYLKKLKIISEFMTTDNVVKKKKIAAWMCVAVHRRRCSKLDSACGVGGGQQMALPLRDDHLRESQESNKENAGHAGDISKVVTERHVRILEEEGYMRTEIIRALNIANDDFDIARVILHEFVRRK